MIATEAFDARDYIKPIATQTFTLPAIPYQETSQKQTYTVEDLQAILSISRSAAYALVKEAPFRVAKIGSTIRISKKSFHMWLDGIA